MPSSKVTRPTLVAIWTLLTLSGCIASESLADDSNLKFFLDRVAVLSEKSYNYAYHARSILFFDQTSTIQVLDSSSFEKSEEIHAPCLSDSGASQAEWLFVGCYGAADSNLYMSESNGTFRTLPELPCERSIKITDSFFRSKDSMLVIAAGPCGFFTLEKPYFSKSWHLLWDVNAYSGIETKKGVILASHVAGKVRNFDSDLEEFESWDIPGAYRMTEGPGNIWISSIETNSVWRLSDDLDEFRLPPDFMPVQGAAYLNDPCVWNETLFVSDRYQQRVFATPISNNGQRWSVYDLGLGAEPTRWLCDANEGPLLVAQGPTGGLFHLELNE